MDLWGLCVCGMCVCVVVLITHTGLYIWWNNKMFMPFLILENSSRMRRHLERVLDVSLYPHSNIISVNVKIMSPKYPALPFLTFSETHLMSEKTQLRRHQRTIPHRNEQWETFFTPRGEIYLYICHLTLSQTHTHTQINQYVSEVTLPRRADLYYVSPERKGPQSNPPGKCHRRQTAALLSVHPLGLTHFQAENWI